MQIINSIINGPDACSYLSGQYSAMQYAQIGEMSPGDYTERLERGWFKFGAFLQRPLCHWCRMCFSMRVPLEEWKPSRSQRRVLKRNAELELKVSSPPVLGTDRVLLHNRYRQAKHALYGWQPNYLTEAGYQSEFIRGPAPMTEISIWENGRLISVLMADVEPEVITAVTHFHDPSLWRRSIGLYTVLQSFLLGQRLGKKWLYLGYYVPHSPSMGYKQQFKPCELRQWNGEWRRQDSPKK